MSSPLSTPLRPVQLPALFIADLHIAPERPDILAAFERFCQGPARTAVELYILGDLFEAWLGDDDDEPIAERTASALAELAREGVTTYFLPGNRDFLLGPAYAARAGLSLLSGPTHVDIAGQTTLLLHGDELCTDDQDHQAFRRQTQDAAWQRAFLERPLRERRQLAAEMRRTSQQAMEAKSWATLDVNADAVAEMFRDWHIERMIHGHTHRPARHTGYIDGRYVERWVLGDWFDQGSMLRVDHQGWASIPLV